ncbi:MarR family winged helix-turn-helix transcriptional regulator [Halocola ammonii]
MDSIVTETRELPLGKLFGQLTKEYVGTFSKRLEHLPIKRHFYPLMLISQGNGRLSQTCLAGELHLDKVSVLRLVDYLSEHDCVERRQNPEDRREQFLHCTELGESYIPDIKKALIETNELCLEGLDSEEVKLLEKLLSRVTCNLHHQPQDTYSIEFIKKEK